MSLQSFGGALGDAFELKTRPRRGSSVSSASSSSLSFDLSSTDDELSFDASPSSRDTSWGNIQNRDPFSASAKPVDGLKLYGLPDNASLRRVSPGAQFRERDSDKPGRMPPHIDATPKANDLHSNDTTPRYSPSVSQRDSSSFGRVLFPNESEAQRWDQVISTVIDKGEADVNLDLSLTGGNPDLRFTYIPNSIADLRNLVVLRDPSKVTTPSNPLPSLVPRGFSRAVSAPAATFNRRPLGGTAVTPSIPSIQEKPSASNTPRIQLFLANNSITSLPRELFLINLTVLSLRSNQLEFIPPSIAELKNLQELNIANNRIQFLPAELLTLRHCTNLSLQPNPFLSPPVPKLPPSIPSQNSTPKRILGPLKRIDPLCDSRVPTLVELAYRVLLSPADSGHPSPLPSSSPPLRLWQEYAEITWKDAQEIHETLKAATPVISSSSSSSLDTHPATYSMKNRNGGMPPVASKTSRVDLPLSLGDELDFAHPTKPSPKLLLNQAAQHFPHYCPSPTHDRPSGLVPLPRQQPRTPVFDQSERSKRQFERSTTAAMLGRAATPLSTSQPNSSSQPQSTRVPGPSFPSTFASNPAFRSVSAAPTSSPRSLTPTFSAPSTMQPHLQRQDVRKPYLLHAEERLEWVREIAGVPVLGSQLVPILWRGCTTGCLDFLNEDDEEEEEEKGSSGGEKEDDEFDFGSDSDVPEGFGTALPTRRLGMLRAANSAGALPRGMQVADSQRTIRPGMIDEEDEDEDRDRDGFDVDGWRMGS